MISNKDEYLTRRTDIYFSRGRIGALIIGFSSIILSAILLYIMMWISLPSQFQFQSGIYAIMAAIIVLATVGLFFYNSGFKGIYIKLGLSHADTTYKLGVALMFSLPFVAAMSFYYISTLRNISNEFVGLFLVVGVLIGLLYLAYVIMTVIVYADLQRFKIKYTTLVVIFKALGILVLPLLATISYFFEFLIFAELRNYTPSVIEVEPAAPMMPPQAPALPPEKTAVGYVPSPAPETPLATPTAQSIKDSGVKICPYCGAKNPKNAMFCMECGARL